MKFNDSLSYQWGEPFGSDNSVLNSLNVADGANDVAIDKDGDLYMTGQVGGLSTFGTNTSTIVLGQNSNNEEAYVLEVSGTGTSLGGVSATGVAQVSQIRLRSHPTGSSLSSALSLRQ